MLSTILRTMAKLGKATTGTRISSLHGISSDKATIAWIGRIFNNSNVEGAGNKAGLDVIRRLG